MLPVLILANPKKKRPSMAKKKKKKKRNAGGARRNGAPRKNPPRPNGGRRRGARRRRNPKGDSSAWAVLGGVVAGGLLGGALDYGLAGSQMTASPTRRAMIFGGLTVASTVTAVLTDGNVAAVATGIAGSQAGLAIANTGRAVAVWVASKDEKKAQKDDKPAVNADGTMKGVVASPDAAMRSVVQAGIPRARQPAELESPRRVNVTRGNLRAVVMERSSR